MMPGLWREPIQTTLARYPDWLGERRTADITSVMFSAPMMVAPDKSWGNLRTDTQLLHIRPVGRCLELIVTVPGHQKADIAILMPDGTLEYTK